MINGMNIETARRYLETRDKLDIIIDRIYAIAYLQSLLDDPIDEMKIDSLPLGKIGKVIAQNILKINETLDEFESFIDITIQLKNHNSR